MGVGVGVRCGGGRGACGGRGVGEVSGCGWVDVGAGGCQRCLTSVEPYDLRLMTYNLRLTTYDLRLTTDD